MKNKSYKIDFHTHSVASPDGSITLDQYQKILESGTLDCIAITDHNHIDFAVSAQKHLGEDRIIIGEEITTKQGEIIGLFLTHTIEPGQDIVETIRAIKAQHGIVYIPHPFETVRKGITKQDLNSIKDDVDCIESANGRAFFQNFGPEAHTWARLNRTPALASSDGHRAKSLGLTYSILTEIPHARTFVKLAETARLVYSRPRLLDITAPKTNRLRGRLGIKNAP